MKGLAIIEKTDTETKGFYIDQDALECARLNARVKQRTESAESAQRGADQKNLKAEKAAAMRKAYTVKTIGYILSRLCIIGAVTWAGTAGMIHPAICVPVNIICLSAACIRLGMWLGVGRKQRNQSD